MRSENIWSIFVRRRIRRGCYNPSDESTRLGNAEVHRSRSTGSNHSTSVVVLGIFHGARCASGQILHRGISQGRQRSLNGLTLWIENGGLQHYPDVCFHRSDYSSPAESAAVRKSTKYFRFSSGGRNAA